MAEDRIALELALAESAIEEQFVEASVPFTNPEQTITPRALIYMGPRGHVSRHVLSFMLSGVAVRAEEFIALLGPWWGCRQLRHTCRTMASDITADRRDSALQHVRALEFRQDADGKAYTFEQIAHHYRSQYTQDDIRAYWNTLPAAPFSLKYFFSSSSSHSLFLDHKIGKEQLWLQMKLDPSTAKELSIDSERAIWTALTAQPLGSRLWLLSMLAEVKPEVLLDVAFASTLEKWCARGVTTESVASIDRRFLASRVPTVLCIAAQCNMPTVVRLMLAARANPDVRSTPNNRTPLMLAVAGGHTHICSLLVDYGANIHLRDVHGRTPEQLIGSSRTSRRFLLLKLRSLLPLSVRQCLRRMGHRACVCLYWVKEYIIRKLQYVHWRVWQHLHRYRFGNIGPQLTPIGGIIIMVLAWYVKQLIIEPLSAAGL